MKWVVHLMFAGLVASASSQSSPDIVWSEGQSQFMTGYTSPSPDGKWVHDGQGKIRHADTLQLRIAMQSLPSGHASFSAHSQWLMSCSANGVKFFLPFLDLQTGVLKATTTAPVDVLGIEVSGNQGFVAADDREAVLWARVGGIWMLQFKWPVAPGQLSGAIAISPDRRLLAVGTHGPSILIYDLVNRSTTPLQTLAVPSVPSLRRISFAKNGAHLLAVAGHVRIWRTSDWGHVGDVTVPDDYYWQIEPANNPNEFWLSHSLNPRKLSRFDFQGNELFSLESVYGASGLCSLPNNRLLASMLPGLLTIDEQNIIREAPGAMGDLSSLSLTSNGKEVAATAWDGYVRVYDRATGRERFARKTGSHYTRVVRPVPDGLRWVVKDEDYWSTSGNNSIKVYDTVGNLLSPPGIGTSGGQLDVSPVAHPTLGHIAAASHDTSVRVLRLSNYTFPVTLTLPDTVNSIVFSPDGLRLAVVYGQKTLRIYRTSDWGVQHQELFAGNVRDLTFDQTASKIYLLSDNTNVLVRRRTGDTWVSDGFIAADEFGTALAVSRDSRVLAVGSYQQLKLIYLPTRATLTVWQGFWIHPKIIAFSIANDQIFYNTGPMLYCAKNPFPAFISSMSVSPTTIQPGQSSLLTVNITKPAPAGGLTIQLVDYTPNVWTPATIKIPAGQYSASTSLLTVPGSRPGTYTIVGTVFGASASTKLTIVP